MADAVPQPGKSESMEDILQSIKRIIEDDTAGEPRPGDDVLELTQVVKDDGTVAPLATKAPPAAPGEPIVKNPEPAPEPRVELPPAAIETPQPAPLSKPIVIEDGLVSDEAAHAAAAALRPIMDGSHKDYTIPPIPSRELRGGQTVEDLIIEALKPMLKHWLDEHLPMIVKKIVEKEVKRIVTFHND